MGPKLPPDQSARQVFASMLEGNCHHSWGIFSAATQKHFADWALKDLYQRNNEAATGARLSAREVKLMFESNDPMLIKFFWRRFFFASSANDLFRYGYFSTQSVQGKNAIVKVTLKYPNGQVQEVNLPMINERGGWKLAYVENNLPF